jgi:hypothetical protein
MHIERKIDADVNTEVGAEDDDGVYYAGNSVDILSQANASLASTN